MVKQKKNEEEEEKKKEKIVIQFNSQKTLAYARGPIVYKPNR